MPKGCASNELMRTEEGTERGCSPHSYTASVWPQRVVVHVAVTAWLAYVRNGRLPSFVAYIVPVR